MRCAALLLLAAVVAFGACADETTLEGAPLGWGPASGSLYQPPAGGGGIMGDWAFCEDAECAERGSSGVRFAADGTYATLWIWGEDATGAVYCVYTADGTYSWDGAGLTMHDVPDVGELSCRVTFADDRALLDCGMDYTLALRRLRGHEEPCPPMYD
jgi:hypothetical protein